MHFCDLWKVVLIVNNLNINIVVIYMNIIVHAYENYVNFIQCI